MKRDLFFLVTTLFLELCFGHNIFRSKRDTVSVRKERTQMCPDSVTKYMPDGQTLMCAAIYREEYCAGSRLPIEVGNVTMRFNSDWFYEISSVEMNPNCTLKICRSSNLEGTCKQLNGEKSGQNYNKLLDGFDDHIASLACACQANNLLPGSTTTVLSQTTNINILSSTCPTTITHYMPDDERPLCATAYKNRHCGGEALHIAASTVTIRLNDDWSNKISSIKVNPDCAIKICNLPDFNGTCKIAIGDSMGSNYDLIDLDFDNNAVSLICSCIGTVTDTPTATTLSSKRTCPAINKYMPDGRRMLCATIFKETNCQGSRLAVEDENVTIRLSGQWSNEISSIQVNPNCRMKLCGLPYFGGSCTNMTGGIFGENYYYMPLGFHNYGASYSCFCDNDYITTDISTTTTTTTRPTTNFLSSTCPTTITHYMPDGVRPLCATAYKNIHCGGEALHIEASNITNRLTLDWSWVISSIKLNPNCSIRMCNLSNFTGTCQNFTASEYGTSYNLMYHFDNDARSLACFCNGKTNDMRSTKSAIPIPKTCATAMDRYMPDGRRAVCASIFKEENCQGSRLAVQDGNVTMNLDYQWYNKISSIQINPNCRIKVCGLPYLGGLCTNMTGGIFGKNYDQMPGNFNNYIASFSCFCDNEHVTTTDFSTTTTMASTTTASKSSYRYRIGNTLPPFIPNQFNVPTCALFMKGIMQPGASSYWIEEQIARRMPSSLAGVSSFNYIMTAPGCHLLYCNNTDLNGQCGTVSLDRFKFFFDGFRVNSFLCDCHTE